MNRPQPAVSDDAFRGDEGVTVLTRSGVVIDLRTQTPVLRRSERDRMSVPFADVKAGFTHAEAEIAEAIQKVVDRGDFVLGEAVERFENDFAAYCMADHAVGVDSGFSALELALRAFGIGPGDEVITVANTFVATAAAIESCGARPVLVDADPITYNIDPNRIEDAITPRTRALIPVHLYGQPVDMDAIDAIAERHGLVVIEDACQAHGASYRGRRPGSLGHAAAFSFYPSKNLGAFGDGGMVVTNDPEAAKRLRLLRNLGSGEKYRHSIRGFNHRLDTLHAAVLEAKLPLLDKANHSRRVAASIYEQLLDDTPLQLPAVMPDVEHVFHLYVVQTDDRDALRDHLASYGVSTGIHYPIPIHLQEAYADLGYGPGDFPVSETAAGRIMSLPMFPEMSTEELVYVSDAVHAFFEGG